MAKAREGLANGIGMAANNTGWINRRVRFVSVLLWAGAGLAPLHAQTATTVHVAYCKGSVVSWRPAVAGGGRELKIGEAVLGTLSSQHRPRDHRPNLYIVAPGGQEHSGDGGQDLTFDLVLNELPESDSAVEWDVYWAVILDPSLHFQFPPAAPVPAAPVEVTSEHELILAAQGEFIPGADFDFDQIPGAPLLRENLHVDSMQALQQFRHSDGSLPRLLIVPSHLVVRASAFALRWAKGEP
jgi:hypothetical protein